MAYCLEVLGWLAARGSRFDQAGRLLGAADSLWRGTGNRLSGIAVLQQIRQRVADQAREALGDAGYETARAQGAALELDTVVACAVDDRAVDDRAVDTRGPSSRPSGALPATFPSADGDSATRRRQLPRGGGRSVDDRAR